VNKASALTKKLGLEGHIKFFRTDANEYPCNYTNYFDIDIVLLIDILEHIENPADMLEKLRPKLKKKSLCLVSVPTYNYERFFGKVFHKKAGHVRQGYILQELNNLFEKIGGRMIYYKYNTGLISNLGCAIYYRSISDNKYLTALKSLALYPFRFLDFYNNDRVSSSLFAAYSFNS